MRRFIPSSRYSLERNVGAMGCECCSAPALAMRRFCQPLETCSPFLVRRMLMRRVFAALCVLLIGVSAPVVAQVTTGTIVGTVTDESGAVLPGVTATLQGAGVAGQPTTVTGSEGAYRFPSVPPGEYALTFTLQGFSTVRRERIPVPLGGTVEINTQLKVSTLQETVTVVGESPVVNAASTQVATNLNRNWVENAP